MFRFKTIEVFRPVNIWTTALLAGLGCFLGFIATFRVTQQPLLSKLGIALAIGVAVVALVSLEYRICFRDGVPKVVYGDSISSDYRLIVAWRHFVTFLGGLVLATVLGLAVPFLLMIVVSK